MPIHVLLYSAMGGSIYIMANRRNDVLYVGVTSVLSRRAWEQRKRMIEGFTKRLAEAEGVDGRDKPGHDALRL